MPLIIWRDVYVTVQEKRSVTRYDTGRLGGRGQLRRRVSVPVLSRTYRICPSDGTSSARGVNGIASDSDASHRGTNTVMPTRRSQPAEMLGDLAVAHSSSCRVRGFRKYGPETAISFWNLIRYVYCVSFTISNVLHIHTVPGHVYCVSFTISTVLNITNHLHCVL